MLAVSFFAVSFYILLDGWILLLILMKMYFGSIAEQEIKKLAWRESPMIDDGSSFYNNMNQRHGGMKKNL